MLNQPFDVHLNILSHLNFKDLTTTVQLNKYWKRAANHQFLWQKLFQRYFPDIFKTLTPSETCDWKALFIKNYQATLEGFSPKIQKLLYSLMTEDFSSLKKIKLSIYEPLVRNKTGKQLYSFIRAWGNQEIFNHFFSTGITDLQQENLNKSRKITIFKNTNKKLSEVDLRFVIECGIMLNQDSATLEPFLSQVNHDIWLSYYLGDAARHNSPLSILALLKIHPDLRNFRDNKQRTPLFLACNIGFQDVVDYLLCDPNIELDTLIKGRIPRYNDDINLSALYWALIKNHPKIALTLIAKGASINLISEPHKAQAIHFAARIGSMDVIDAILKQDKTKLDCKDGQGFTPLFWALEYNQPKAALALIEKGASIDLIIEPDKERAIHLASKIGSWDVIDAILKQDEKLLDCKDAQGRTPLFWALENNRPKTALALIKKGASIDFISEPDKVRAIHLASKIGFLYLIDAILKQDEKQLDCQDEKGRIPLYWALINNQSKAALALMEKGASIQFNLKSKLYQPIHLAAKIGSLEIIETILKKDKTQLDWEDEEGKTPLFWALKNNQPKAALALIEKGASIDLIIEPDKIRAIHLAAQIGSIDVIDAILKLDETQLNCIDAQGQTPLLWAASKGHTKVVAYLLKLANINLNATTQDTGRIYDKWTVLDWAVASHNIETIKIVLSEHRKRDISPQLKSPLDKLTLEDHEKAIIELYQYIYARKQKPDFNPTPQMFANALKKTSDILDKNIDKRFYSKLPITLFGVHKDNKLEFAEAIADVIENEADISTLEKYQNQADNGELGKIYNRLDFTKYKENEEVNTAQHNDFQEGQVLNKR